MGCKNAKFRNGGIRTEKWKGNNGRKGREMGRSIEGRCRGRIKNTGKWDDRKMGVDGGGDGTCTRVRKVLGESKG